MRAVQGISVIDHIHYFLLLFIICNMSYIIFSYYNPNAFVFVFESAPGQTTTTFYSLYPTYYIKLCSSVTVDMSRFY